MELAVFSPMCTDEWQCHHQVTPFPLVVPSRPLAPRHPWLVSCHCRWGRSFLELHTGGPSLVTVSDFFRMLYFFEIFPMLYVFAVLTFGCWAVFCCVDVPQFAGGHLVIMSKAAVNIHFRDPPSPSPENKLFSLGMGVRKGSRVPYRSPDSLSAAPSGQSPSSAPGNKRCQSPRPGEGFPAVRLLLGPLHCWLRA